MFWIRYVQTRQQSPTWVGPKQNKITPKCNENYLIIKFGSMINEQGFPRGSYGKCKGRCLISVLTVGRGIVPVNFRMKWLW